MLWEYQVAERCARLEVIVVAVRKKIRLARATRQTKKRDHAQSVEKRSPHVPARNVRLIRSLRARVQNRPRPIVLLILADTKNRFCFRCFFRSLEEGTESGV